MNHPFLVAYNQVVKAGNEVSPRGERILELEDYVMTFQPTDSVVSSYQARNLNLNYCKEEFLWYLRGDRFDTSIEQHATLWKKLRQADGGFNSNYGQYMFGEQMQFAYAMEALASDRDSRRAVMVLLNRDHLYHENTDIVCTYGISLRIRQNRLNMSVNMRSNDLIFGTTNDVFCFGMIHRLALAVLREVYPDLKLGVYNHKADSLHVYERHWPMLNELVSQGESGYYHIPIPELTLMDLEWLDGNPSEVCDRPNLEFASWITQ